MSYNAFYSTAVSIRRNLQALDNVCLATNAQGIGDANAEETLICQRGDSGAIHEQAGAGAKGEQPTTNPEPVSRGRFRGSLSSPFEF